jgi:antitoxin Phd
MSTLAASPPALPTWKLEDAKARLSELIRRAAEGKEPQRITVRGKDAVVVISAQEYERLLPLMRQPSLRELLVNSPFSRLEFEPLHEPITLVRDVPL